MFSSLHRLAFVIVLLSAILSLTFQGTLAQSPSLEDEFFTSGIKQVWQGDVKLYERFYGYQNREAKVPISSETQFRIGSNSKTLTTIALFQLGNFPPTVHSTPTIPT
jgi:CubicO group peptidase (beta-lactamase class C family)